MLGFCVIIIIERAILLMVTGDIRITTRISNVIMVTKAISRYVLSNSNN